MNNAIHQYRTVTDVTKGLAEWLVTDIQQVLQKHDRYTMALSGGNTPKSFYELLAKEYASQINWSGVHVFFDDERYVPFADERNNGAMVNKALLQHINLPPDQVHFMKTDVQGWRKRGGGFGRP